MKRIFRIARLEDRTLLDRGLAREFGERALKPDGFVHLSFAEQIRGTLETHFGDARELALLEIDGERTRGARRFELSRGRRDLPHLYRALEPADIVREWRVAKSGNAFELPEIASGPEFDRQPGPPRSLATFGA